MFPFTFFIDTVPPFIDAIHVGYSKAKPVFSRNTERVKERSNTNAKVR